MTSANSYDLVPYPSAPRPGTHPDQLATAAALFGLNTAPANHCRMLELGCADGGNLIPIAYGLPESEFFGIDFSATEIAQARATAQAVGLENLTLKQADIMEVDAGYGQFDYILACGIYSWVPAPVQDKILEICCRNLAPNGVVFVNYNTLPGWHMRGMVREMMLYHTRSVTDLRERGERSRELLQFVGEAELPELSEPRDEAYDLFIQEVRQDFERYLDSYIIHEYLEEENRPVYFNQFVEHVARHGLQYVAENRPQFHYLDRGTWEAPFFQNLRRMAGDLVGVEQYLDFLTNRKFRSSLLCHQDVALDHTRVLERFTGLQFSSEARPANSVVDIVSDAPVQFTSPPSERGKAVAFTTPHPLTKAALLYLGAIAPHAVSFEILVSQARGGLEANGGTCGEADLPDLVANLLACYRVRLIDVHLHPPHVAPEISARPESSAVARLQARDSRAVTTLLHKTATLNGNVSYCILPYLDGSRTHEELVQVLVELEAQGLLDPRPEGQAAELTPDRKTLAERLERSLFALWRAGLLVE